MTTIAVISMGEMGSRVARRLVERGAQVLTSLAGRTAASAERASAAGVRVVDDIGLVSEASIFMSIVPPASAGEIAERFMPLIERLANKPLFVDCNAIAPVTVRAIAQPFLERGLPFLDASVIGPPPKPEGPQARFYVSGPAAEDAGILREFGLDIRVLSAVLGDASALKMSYAGITKGFQALGASMVLGAARSGVTHDFVSELQSSHPQLYAWLSKQLPIMYAKAYRWDGEMREIATFLEPERGAVGMLTGAADLYQHVAEDNRIGPHSEIISTLDAFIRKDR